MPSDVDGTPAVAGAPPLADRAYSALQSRIEAFRGAVAAAELEVQDELLRRVAVPSVKTEQALVELGPFALGRIDPERFAMLLGVSEEELTPESIDVLTKVDAILAGFAENTTHRVRVEPGGDLRDTVKDGLAELGQAFGAGRAMELARAGMFEPTEHRHLLGPLPFRSWNRAERRLAPPLLVEVRGEDCLPAGLGEFLDGAVTIVVVASGPTTPAPLARLVTPGTFVMQTATVDDLQRIEAIQHPAVVLLFDEDRPDQACFVHDPIAGTTPWSRISVARMPEDAPTGRGRRPPVSHEELLHLKALSEAPATGGTGTAGPALHFNGAGHGPDPEASAPTDSPINTSPAAEPATIDPAITDPADRLASWLLARTDLSGL